MKKLNQLKLQAIKLRKNGKSHNYIRKSLNIPKSTLSLWLKNIKLTQPQKEKLHQNWKKGLIKARKHASISHKKARKNRISKIEIEVKDFINSLNINKKALELFLAGLYLGDGFKVTGRLALGSSNPQIALLFITILRKIYNVQEKKIRIAIYARADQNSKTLINYWSKLLKVPKKQFHKTQFDKRTLNKKTYSEYKGVCAVNYFDINLQRRILAISEEMIQYVINPKRSRSSVG